MNRRLVLAVTLCIIFTFWFLLTKDNFFHWDEWSFLLGFNQNPINFLTKSYGEHYIPLNLLNHYLLFKTFGLNNLPFQLSVLFFHLLNCLILYKIVFRLTKKFYLSILACLLFGISNAYVEDVIWSQGISNIASATFVFLAYYLHLLNPKNLKVTFFSGLCLTVAPLFNDLGILMPFAFIAMIVIESKNVKKISWKQLLVYLFFGLVNLSIIFYFSHSAISHSAKLSFESLIKIPQFILYGILRGTIMRFIYPGFHFIQGFQQTKTILVSLISLIALISSSLFLYNWLGNKKTRGERIRYILIFSIMIIFGYLAVALGRVSFGLTQAGISRYVYQPFFFLILIIFTIAKDYPKKIKLVFVVSLFLLLINSISIVRFQTEFWGKMVGRDRQFIEDAKYLFANNGIVCDYGAPGIFPPIKLSKLWFLNPNNIFIEKDCEKIIDGLNVSKESKEIYSRLQGEYQRKFD